MILPYSSGSGFLIFAVSDDGDTIVHLVLSASCTQILHRACWCQISDIMCDSFD